MPGAFLALVLVPFASAASGQQCAPGSQHGSHCTSSLIQKRTSLGVKLRDPGQATDDCIDDDERLLKAVRSKHGEQALERIKGCADVKRECDSPQVKALCCLTCGLQAPRPPAPSPPAVLPPRVLPPADPEVGSVQLFLLGGQSECRGNGKQELLEQDPNYAELHGAQEGVWFAGWLSPNDHDRFLITRMRAGLQVPGLFGPEVSFGERLHAVTGERIMIVKHCIGGTNVREEWNPSTAMNSWSDEEDDGSAEFLAAKAKLNFKSALFASWIYTARRTMEALEAAEVPFEWKGIIWVQGNADKDSTWQEFGEDTARVWTAARQKLQVPNLPVVDKGAASKHHLRTGKAHAVELAGNATNVEVGLSTQNLQSDCVPGPGKVCGDSFFTPDVYNFYGWDPQMPEEVKLGFGCNTNKTFRWFVDYPSDQHSEYEQMVLNGRMLADAFINAFVGPDLLDAEMVWQDPALRWPWPKCPAGTGPSADNICWIDMREE